MKCTGWMGGVTGLLMIGATAFAAPARAAPIDDCAELTTLNGRYELTGARAERHQQAEAVERVVNQMSWLFRRVARSRLLDANPLPQVIEVQCDGGSANVWFDGRRFTAPLDGRVVWVTGTHGDPVRLQARVHGDRLVLNFEGDGGGKEVTLWADGGRRVILDTRVYSPRLPADVVYETSYAATRR